MPESRLIPLVSKALRTAFIVLCLSAGGVLAALQQPDPIVRIGLDQNAATLTVRASEAFMVEQQSTRSARFSVVLAVGNATSNSVMRREDLTYRMAIELDSGRILLLPMT